MSTQLRVLEQKLMRKNAALKQAEVVMEGMGRMLHAGRAEMQNALGVIAVLIGRQGGEVKVTRAEIQAAGGRMSMSFNDDGSEVTFKLLSDEEYAALVAAQQAAPREKTDGVVGSIETAPAAEAGAETGSTSGAE